MAKIPVQVEGLKELQKQLENLDEQAREGAADAVDESAEALAQGMRNRVPIDEGTLLADIDTQVDRAALTATVGPLSDDSYYAFFVEFGTSSMGAQPFATPAVEEEMPRLAGRIAERVGEQMPDSS